MKEFHPRCRFQIGLLKATVYFDVALARLLWLMTLVFHELTTHHPETGSIGGCTFFFFGDNQYYDFDEGLLRRACDHCKAHG